MFILLNYFSIILTSYYLDAYYATKIHLVTKVVFCNKVDATLFSS